MGGCRRVRVAAGRMGGGMAHAGPASIVRVPASHAQPMAPTHPPMIVQVDTYMTRVLQCLRLLPHITDIEVSAGGRKRRMRTPSAPALPCGATRAHTPTRPPTRPPTHAPPHTRARADGLWRPDRSQGPWFAITQAPEEVAQHLAAASGGAAVKPEPGGEAGGFGGGGRGGAGVGGRSACVPLRRAVVEVFDACAGGHSPAVELPPSHPPTPHASSRGGAGGSRRHPGARHQQRRQRGRGRRGRAEGGGCGGAAARRGKWAGASVFLCVWGGGGSRGRVRTHVRVPPPLTRPALTLSNPATNSPTRCARPLPPAEAQGFRGARGD